MSTNEQDHGAALDVLNRMIAEALGYTLEKTRKGDKLIFTIRSPENHIIRQATVTEDSPLSEGLVWFNIPHWHIPDWARDTGAALALCVEIAEPLGLYTVIKSYPPERSSTNDDSFMSEFYKYSTSSPLNHISFWREFRAFGATSAEALARLALAAVEDTRVQTDE